MLLNGERQVAPELSGIRRDHVARYEFAAERLAGKRVIDLACGVGYGASILAAAGCHVLAIDRSEEAIAYAREHYAHPNIRFLAAPAEALDFGEAFDAAVCFETIEHLYDPLPVLRELNRWAPSLLASVPNEEAFPYRCPANGMQGWAHHYRHYTSSEFVDLLERAGYSVLELRGQEGPASDVEPAEGEIDRTIIAIAERAAVPAVEPEPEAAAPEHVAIVGLGPSGMTFFELVRGLGGRSAYCDEVWGINALGDVFDCDRIFHMDDVAVQERRAEARPGSNIAAMVKWLRRHPGPIYTSVVRPGYPGLVAFPLEAVLNGRYDTNGGAPYFNSTAAYAVAYAIHIGVRRLSLFGMDYTQPNAHHAEQGRACVEFWLGIAAARGIEITVPDTSTLLDACAPDRERLYGYDGVDVTFHPGEGGRIRLDMTPRELPTAEEVERRYDHSRHPNRLVRGDKP